MTTALTTSALSSVLPEEALDRLRAETRQMGLNLTCFDRQGKPVGGFSPCPIAAAIGLPSQCGLSDLQQLVADVVAEGRSDRGQTACGCCAIGLPLMQRRRVTGAATICFPVSQMLANDTVAAAMTRSAVREADLQREIREFTRYGQADVGHLSRLLHWLLDRELVIHVANDELAMLSTNLANCYEEISLLYRISSSMRVTGSPQDFLQDVCNDLLEVMHIEAAVGVLYSHPPAVEDDIVVISGQIDLNIDQVRMLTATQVAPRLANRPILDNKFAAYEGSGLGKVVSKLVAVPLVKDDRVMGMLLGLNKRNSDFDSSDLKLINSIANQASVFMVNNRLYADLQDLLMGVLHALTATIDAKDPYTCGHSQRVALLSRKLAQACGLNPSKVQQIYLSGLMHDIGKIGVPERVLCKEGRLTAEEYECVKRHPAIGAKILQGIRQLDEIIVGILTHHERPDGRGYPQGLSGHAVPMEGRIVGIADVFDAMTSDRTYRKALKLEDVLIEIRRCCGTQFDPKLVDLLLAMDMDQLMAELHHSGLGAKSAFPMNLLEGANE